MSTSETDKNKIHASDLADEIKKHLLNGQKIVAIAMLKKSTGVSLKEAKDAVEKMEKKMIESGELIPQARKGRGILSLIIFIIVTSLVAYFLFS